MLKNWIIFWYKIYCTYFRLHDRYVCALAFILLKRTSNSVCNSEYSGRRSQNAMIPAWHRLDSCSFQSYVPVLLERIGTHRQERPSNQDYLSVTSKRQLDNGKFHPWKIHPLVDSLITTQIIPLRMFAK